MKMILLFFLFTLLFMFFFSYSMWFGFQYKIKDNKVITIKAGIIPLGEINIYQIKKICKKRSSSYIYATSMDKIISIQTFDKKEWNISPINKELFITSVVGLNPKIEVNI